MRCSTKELITSYIKDVEAMAEWLLQQLISLGVKAEKRAIGQHKLEGKDVDLPPVIIGQLGNDPNKVSYAFLITHLRPGLATQLFKGVKNLLGRKRF